MFSDLLINFYKYQGTGNDFVIIDQFDQAHKDFSREEIAHICNRRFGVGADGMMIIRQHETADFEMIYFNSDGNDSSMCGNGGRCIVMFAFLKNYIEQSCTFKATDGYHKAICDGVTVALEMSHISELKTVDDAFVIDTGSPHYVYAVDEKQDPVQFLDLAKSIRYSEAFKTQGININAYFDLGNACIEGITYERGVEDITLSCGTGVTAMAIVHSHRSQMEGDVEIDVKNIGGDLSVSFSKTGNKIENVWLKGPAVFAFEGQIKLN